MSGRIIHIPPAAATLAALLWLGGCAGTAAPATASASGPSCPEVDEGAVAAVLETQRAAWNRGDLDGFLAGYERSDALLFTSGAKVRRGFEETRAKYQARYGTARETMGTLAFEILDVRALGRCADAAIVLGRWQLTDTPEAGSGVFSVILEHHERGWEIVHDHTSSDPPATPEPAPQPQPQPQ